MAKQQDFARSVWNFVKKKNDQRLKDITQIYIEEGEQLKEYLQEKTPKRTSKLCPFSLKYPKTRSRTPSPTANGTAASPLPRP